MDIFNSTVFKVPFNTDPDVNNHIRNETIANLMDFTDKDSAQITQRISELNNECDTERVLETCASSIVILSSILGITKSKWFLLATGAVGASLLLHALQGWCPPIPVIRRFGVRTAEEINNEKIVLKMIRGDFTEEFSSVEDMLSKVEKQ